MRPSPFLLLCATGLFAIFSSTLAKSPVLPLFAGHLGADAAGIGLMAALGPLTGILGSIPAGLLADRYGRRRMLLLAALIFATAPLLYLPADNLLLLGLARIYHGLATAIFMPVALALVSDLFAQGRGERIGWFTSATLAGRFMAPLAGGLLLANLGLPPTVAFQVVFLVCFVGGLGSLLLALGIGEVKKSAAASGQVTGQGARQEAGQAAAGKEVGQEAGQAAGWEQDQVTGQVPEPGREMYAAFRRVAATPGVLPAAVAQAAVLFLYGVFETFLPLRLLAVGMGAGEAGFLISLQIITLALSKPLLGRFSDQHGRRGQIFWGLLAGAGVMGLLAMATSFVLLLVAAVVTGLVLAAVTSAAIAMIADLSPPADRGAAMGILSSIMDVGHAAGPLLAGLIALYYGLPAALLATAALIALAALLFRLPFSRGGNLPV